MSDGLIYIGEKQNKHRLEIYQKLDFYDAVSLSKQPLQNIFYQFIPLRQNRTVFIHFIENNIRLTYQKQSLQIISEKYISYEEVFDILNHFAIKEGKKVSYLTRGPKPPLSQKRIKSKSESKKVDI